MVQALAGSDRSPWGWALGRSRGEGDGATSGTPAAAQRLLAVHRTAETDLSLTVQTKEGDTVTISVDHEVESTMLRYARKGGDGGSAGLVARSRSVTDSIGISVDGDLSDDELADVKALIDRVIAGLTPGASSAPAPPTAADGGDSTPARGAGTATTANADPTDTLAGFTLSVTRSQALDVLKIRTSGAPTDPKLAPAPQPFGPAPAADGPAASGVPAIAPAPADGTPQPAGDPASAVAPSSVPAWLLDLLRAASGSTVATPAAAPICLTPTHTTA